MTQSIVDQLAQALAESLKALNTLTNQKVPSSQHETTYAIATLAESAMASYKQATRHGLPAALDFAPTFVSVFAAVTENGYSQLQTDDPEAFADQDDFRDTYSRGLSETLAAMGVEEPETEGGSLDWLAQLHELTDPLLPNLCEWITE
jgi:hypothetical protein